jgi:hypothetical protein
MYFEGEVKYNMILLEFTILLFELLIPNFYL